MPTGFLSCGRGHLGGFSGCFDLCFFSFLPSFTRSLASWGLGGHQLGVSGYRVYLWGPCDRVLWGLSRGLAGGS